VGTPKWYQLVADWAEKQCFMMEALLTRSHITSQPVMCA